MKIGCVNKSTVVFQIASSVYLFPEQAGSGFVNIWLPHSVDLGELLRPPRDGLAREFFRDMVDGHGRVPLPRMDMLKIISFLGLPFPSL